MLRDHATVCSVECVIPNFFLFAGGKKGDAPLGTAATMHMGRQRCAHCHRKAMRSLNAWISGAAEKMCGVKHSTADGMVSY